MKQFSKERVAVMWQTDYCPNCRAPVSYGDRFCGNCGISLNWVAQQIPPSLPFLHGHQNNGQQQTWYQQPGWHEQSGRPRPTVDSQESVSTNLNQRQQQRHINANHGTVPQSKSSSRHGPVTPMSIEIPKLLEGFFNKHIECKKVK